MSTVASVSFTNNTAQVVGAIDAAVEAFLLEAGMTVSGAATSNSRVDTGQLKSSWSERVNKGDQTVTIGSPLQNAIWEEFGTGIYAEGGKGRRKVPWFYKDAKGKWHATKGKRPNRTLKRAIDANKAMIKAVAQSRFGSLGG